MRTVPVNTFLVDAARRVFINPRTNRPGLPVSEFPRVLLGSSVTLRFDLVAGGRPFEVPAGQGVVASLGYLDGRGRPFYTAQAARVDGSASSFDVGFDFTGADKARLRPGALWFMLRAGDRNILKDSGRLDPGPWPSPLPPTPYQETHIPSEGSEVLRLRPTPTLFLLGTLEDGTARTVELDADALADGRLYECNRVLFKGAAGASLLFDGADRQPGETPQAGWRTYMISRYPDGTLAVDTQTGDSAYEVWLDGLPEGAPSSPGDYLAFLKGEKGDPNTLSIGTVVTDEIPSATITGEAPNQTLNLVLPKGDKGDPNTLSIGTVLKGDDAAATITGTAPNQTLNLTLPKGDPNTLSIGTVTQADTPAATITGEAPNQTLNLVLPKGDKGDTGLSSYEDWLDEGHEGTREDYLEWLQDGAGEKIENKTQEIDAESPSEVKYPSEKAFVGFVAGEVSTLNTAIGGKVDKEAGKVLSDNNFTTAEKNKLESALTSVPDASTTVKGVVQIATGAEVTTGEDTVKAVVPATLKTELDKKVTAVDGKALSTNDFTDAYKTKVNADVESVSTLPTPAVALLNRAYFLTAVDGTKKAGTIWKCVAAGESYVFQQIQTDLNQLTDADNLLFDGDYDSLDNKPTIPTDLSTLTDNTGLFAAKENTANKATDFSTVNNVKFPTVQAVKDFAQNETLTELTGADVSVAPWTQSKWSASGVCSLTATGWAESGVQTSEILITLAAGSTPSVIGAAVSDNDVLSAAGVYSCFIRNEDGVVRFKIAGFTEAV